MNDPQNDTKTFKVERIPYTCIWKESPEAKTFVYFNYF